MNILHRFTRKSLLANRSRTLVTIIGIILSMALFTAVIEGAYSGQQQRVSIGRALMNAPAVVLADEPTGNLDSRNSQEIVELLRQSNVKYKQTLIVITHDESIALQADRIVAIEDGRIVRDERIRGGAK